MPWLRLPWLRQWRRDDKVNQAQTSAPSFSQLFEQQQQQQQRARLPHEGEQLMNAAVRRAHTY